LTRCSILSFGSRQAKISANDAVRFRIPVVSMDCRVEARQ
jgi:hypothetical protein